MGSASKILQQAIYNLLEALIVSFINSVLCEVYARLVFAAWHGWSASNSPNTKAL